MGSIYCPEVDMTFSDWEDIHWHFVLGSPPTEHLTFEITGTVVSNSMYFPANEYGTYGVLVKAKAGEEFDPANVNGPHATFQGDVSFGSYIGDLANIELRDIELNDYFDLSDYNPTNPTAPLAKNCLLKLRVDSFHEVVTSPITGGWIENCIIDGIDLANRSGIGNASNTSFFANNCLIINCDKYGVDNTILKNSLILNSGNQDTLNLPTGSTNNAVSDSTISGTSPNSLTDQTTAELVNFAGGDWRIKSGSALATAGVAGTFIGAAVEASSGLDIDLDSSETLTLSETPLTVLSVTTATADNLTLNESYSDTFEYVVTTDGLTLSESAGIVRETSTATSDAMTVSETYSDTFELVALTVEGLLTEQYIAQCDIPVSTVDTLSLSEDGSWTADAVIAMTSSETMPIGEVHSTYTAALADCTETQTCLEISTAYFEAPLNTSEGALLESTAAAIETAIATSDAMTLSEQYQASREVSAAVAESLTLTETPSTEVVFNRISSEVLSLGEVASAWYDWSQASSDTVALSFIDTSIVDWVIGSSEGLLTESASSWLSVTNAREDLIGALYTESIGGELFTDSVDGSLSTDAVSGKLES